MNRLVSNNFNVQNQRVELVTTGLKICLMKHFDEELDVDMLEVSEQGLPSTTL